MHVSQPKPQTFQRTTKVGLIIGPSRCEYGGEWKQERGIEGETVDRDEIAAAITKPPKN
jgi:hypothetical protein